MVRTNVGRRKIATALITIMVASVILLSGTLAWQSYNQVALNEAYFAMNPGGRLHDDFVDITFDGDGIAKHETLTFNKDVYVENFTSLVSNGVQIFARIRLDEYMELGDNAGMDGESNTAQSIIAGSNLQDKGTWKTHIPDDTDDPFHQYWDWEMDGQTTYMPTFNKSNNSVEADINGSFRSNFADYTDYAGVSDKHKDVKEETGITIYYEEDGTEKRIEETHTVKETLKSTVMTMQEWMDEGMQPGNFWVWDTDGWAYWANPISPDTATGLLLDGISRTETIINKDWYYGINVVAQFITGDDIGYGEGTGFYDTANGAPPSDDALLLLNQIGVDVTFEVKNLNELRTALEHGGTIVLKDEIEINQPLVIKADTTLDLANGFITSGDDLDQAMISVQGADTTLTINSGSFEAQGHPAIEVLDGATVIINGGMFQGNTLYVDKGSAVIYGGDFANNLKIDIKDTNYDNGTAKITICGGNFYDFNPASVKAGALIPVGYSVNTKATENESTIYQVVATQH